MLATTMEVCATTLNRRLVMQNMPYCPSGSTKFVLVLCGLFASLAVPKLIGQEKKPNVADRFFGKYCYDCHSASSAEAGLDLESITYDLSDVLTFAKWVRIYDRIDSGEMPPKESEAIPANEKRQIQSLFATALTKAHAKQKETVFRRLNRREYTHTMNDIFGTDLRLEHLFPEDGKSHEFDNVGSALNVSLVHLQRYIEAADLVLDSAIEKTVEAPPANLIQANYAETREGEKHIGSAWGQAPDGAVVFFRKLGYPTGMLRTASAQQPGKYRIKVTGYAYQSEDPITFSVGGTTFQRGASKPTYGYFSFEPGEPQSIELEAWIDSRYMIDISPWGISDDDYLIKKNGIDAYPGPGLAILEVELEGPLCGEFPKCGHQLIFEDFERTEIEPANPATKRKSWYQPKFELKTDNVDLAVKKTLRRVAEVTFRRPVQQSEIRDYMKLFQDEFARSQDIEQALKTSIAALLCSTDFLYLNETPVDSAGHLNQFALASRLSYFLSRTTPDAELLDDAKRGTLGESLQKHTLRLIADERLDRFINDFADAWLNLRDIEFTAPDRTLYPEFDTFLQYSMLQETRTFLKSALQGNAPVRELVGADYAFLNNRLAQLYGMKGIEGPTIRRVDLPKDSPRGGLLGQASIHKVTANGTNTSPVVRGVWVTERVLGNLVPPPPPGISGVEPDIRGASTLRELLAKHRDSENCRSCHAMIDPPGFAMESFNPIGGWRDRFRSMGDGEKVNLVINARKVRYKLALPVDASGELPSGEAFRDFFEYRDWLASQESTLATALVKKFLTFATGREMGFSDRPEINQIVIDASSKGYRIKDLLLACVQSEIFRSK